MNGAAVHSRPARRTRRADRPGFTLVELLIVMFILVILVALIVSVGKYIMDKAGENKTVTIQVVVNDAIAAYYDEKKLYPAQTGDAQFVDPFDGANDPNEATLSSRSLYEQLMAVVASRKVIDDLPSDATPAEGEPYFLDGYDWPMLYLPEGGLGGKPVLISAGADQSFRDKSDNISSDDH